MGRGRGGGADDLAARRPLVITGRGARGAEAALVRLLDVGRALPRHPGEPGLVPLDHPSFAGAVRAQAMTEADLVVVVGRKLDYQLGYGSPAVFPNARFIRIADTAGELIDNRRGATPALALEAIVEVMGNAPNLDTGWADAMRRRQLQRAGAGFGDTPALGPDGKIHPRCIFDAIAESRPPITSGSRMAATC